MRLALDDQEMWDDMEKQERWIMDMCADAACIEQASEWWLECYSDMTHEMRTEIREIMPLFLQIDGLSKVRFWRIVEVFRRYGYYDDYINVIMSLAYNAGVSYDQCDCYEKYAKKHGGHYVGY